jgi:formate hydrogenlyase transcriptional activator
MRWCDIAGRKHWELQNFIERAVILSPHSVLRAPTSELETFLARAATNVSMTGLEEVERDDIVRALEANNWVARGCNGAAERLGMKRASLVLPNAKAAHQPSSALPTKWRRP